MSYISISLKEAVAKVNNEWFLPAIQRPYVWGNRYEYEKYICRLFDSLYHGYPIGTAILWETDAKVAHREFLRDLGDRPVYKNVDEGMWERHKYLVYDGQQRLQTLYSCLKYTVNNKVLVFDLKYGASADTDGDTGFRLADKNEPLKPYEIKMNYLFSLPKDTESSKIEENINSKIKEGNDLDESAEGKTHPDYEIIRKNIKRLREIFVSDKKKCITYFSISSDTEEKVNDIFERLNTGGMSLSNADLLFAKIIGDKESSNEDFQTDIRTFCDNINIENRFQLDAYDILQIINMVVCGTVKIKSDIAQFRNFPSVWVKLQKALESFISDYLIKKLNLTDTRIIRNKRPMFVLAVYFYKLYESDLSFTSLPDTTTKAMSSFFLTAEVNDWSLQNYTDKFIQIILANPNPEIFPMDEIVDYVKKKDNRAQAEFPVHLLKSAC